MLAILELVDPVWQQDDEQVKRGRGYVYAPKVLFKVYLVGVLKKLGSRRAVHRYLVEIPDVAQACGLAQVPDRRTLDRRLEGMTEVAATQVQVLGQVLGLEEVTDVQTVCSDGSAFKARGPVWHAKHKRTGHVPAGLRGLDKDADWIQSTYHGWVYGYKAHLTVSDAPTTVRAVVSVTVTGASCESSVLCDHLDDLSPLTTCILLDKGYDNPTLLANCQQRQLQVLVPLSKKVGKSTSPERRQRAAYLASPAGKARYHRRGCCIEPFFATLKSAFQLDPLPVRGKLAVTLLITLACYAWNLLALYNFQSNRPLGAVNALLGLL